MPADPLHPTNRIEVDLKILQDRNIDRLHEFAGKWEKTVKVLVDAIGDLGTIVQQGMPDLDQGTKAVPLKRSWGRQGGIYNTPQEDDIPGVGRRGEISEATTQQPTPTRTAAAASAEDKSSAAEFDRNAYLRAQIELGQVGEGFLGMMRYVSRVAQMSEATPGGITGLLQHHWWTAPNYDENGNQMPSTFGANLENFTRNLTMMKGIGTGTAGILNKLSGRFGMPPISSFFEPGASMESQQFGLNVGAGTQPGGSLGFLQRLSGVPILGPIANMLSGAGLKGIEANWNAGLASWFGFNPDLTTQQAKDIESTLNAYGWGGNQNGNQTDFLRNILTTYVSKGHGAWNAEDLMSAGADAAVRYGTGSLQDVLTSFDRLNNSVIATSLSLDIMKKGLNEMQGPVSQQYGVPTPSARLAIQALTDATGLAPQVTGKMLMDSNFWLGVARSHTPLWQLSEPKYATRANLRIGMEGLIGLMPQIIGSNAEWQAAERAAQHGDHGPMHHLETKLQMLYHIDPQLFGGLQPNQVINQKLYGRGMETRAVATSKLNYSNTYEDMRTQLMRAGMSREKLQQFKEWRQKNMIDNGSLESAMKKAKSGHFKALNDLVGQERNEARKLLAQSQSKQEKNAAVKTSISIGLTPQAQQLVKLIQKDHGGKSGSNSWANFGRQAFGDITKYTGIGSVIPGIESGAKWLGGEAGSAAQGVWNDLFGG
jgi:hypothetical protein